jgi:hypothetical protein
MVDEACRTFLEMSSFIPVSPLHLFSFMDEDGGYRKDIMDICKHLISGCDEVWVLGNSPGCKEEEDYARSIGKPVFRCSAEMKIYYVCAKSGRVRMVHKILTNAKISQILKVVQSLKKTCMRCSNLES